MRTFWVVVAVLVGVVFVCSAWTALNPNLQRGVIVCPECNDLGMVINAWSDTSHTSVECHLPNGGDVVVLFERNGYYRVKGYACTGYVLRDFVKLK